MNPVSRLISIIFSIIIVILSFIYFAKNIADISLNDEFKEYNYQSLNSDIEIYQNHFGIPHIIAQNDDDLFFAIGFIHARDRMWQMDFTRKKALGELSEILGEKMLNFDKFMRSVDFENIAETSYNSMDINSKRILQKYSDGINFFLKNNKNDLSYEFGALGYFPKKWEPKHSVMIMKMLSFEMSKSVYGDLVFSNLAVKFGIEKAKSLIPDYPLNSTTMYENLDSNLAYTTYKKTVHNYQILKDLTSHNVIDSQLIDLLKDNFNNSSSIGSNAWAVSNTNSKRKAAILANDPHSALELPTRWYQMAITSPNLNVSGFTIAGNPLIIIGRNDNISWGITNSMVDDWDYFYESVDSTGNKYLNSKNEYVKFKYVADSIKIKDKEAHKYYKRYTEKSAVISDFHFLNQDDTLSKRNNQKRNSVTKDYVLTFQWVASFPSDEFRALYNLNKANNINEFKDALYTWHSPSLNFLYADCNGKIAYKLAGVKPNRMVNCEENFLNRSSDNSCGWAGIESLNYIPMIEKNDGFISNANNKISHKFNNLSKYWEPSSRADRISYLLKNKNLNYSFKDAQYMQNDLYSIYSKDICNIIIPVLDKFSYLLNQVEKNSLYGLKIWDFIQSINSYQTTIYNKFYERLCFNTFADNMDWDLYKQYIQNSSIPSRKILDLLQNENSTWFDDATTNEVENRNYIIYKSFQETIKELRIYFNTDNIRKWEWGQLHKLKISHILNNYQKEVNSLNMNEISLGGNNTTLNNTEWNLNKPFKIVSGQSLRFIADMNENAIYSNLPGGNSGDPVNPNYLNQAIIWSNGAYIKTPFGRLPDKTFDLIIRIKK